MFKWRVPEVYGWTKKPAPKCQHNGCRKETCTKMPAQRMQKGCQTVCEKGIWCARALLLHRAL